MSVLPPAIDDYAEQAPQLLLDQFQDKPRIRAWLLSYVRRVQEAEDVLRDVVVSRLLDEAVGAQLDVLGRLVGERRQGHGDDLYRALVVTRIAINRSQGLADDVVRCLRLLSGTPFASGLPLAFRFADYHPASFDLDVDSAAFSADEQESALILGRVVREARSAGVRGAVLVTGQPGSPSTTPQAYFGSGEDEEADETDCLMSYGEDEPGPMAGVYE